MYGVLGEDKSDAETLQELIRRLAGDPSLPVKTRGYNGCAEMLKKGKLHLGMLWDLGCTRFVIAYDSDGRDPQARRNEVAQRIVKPAGLDHLSCILIPVQEIEAWVLADISAISNVLSSWRPSPIETNPESIPSPKEYLERLSRQTDKRPIYAHATHNPKVAKYLDLEVVRERCPSFRPLYDFVRQP